jgi:hypothetical protein
MLLLDGGAGLELQQKKVVGSSLQTSTVNDEIWRPISVAGFLNLSVTSGAGSIILTIQIPASR